MALSIHLKIEAKGLVNNVLLTNNSKMLNSLYRVFEKDCFSLKYKCQKLSKRARRDTRVPVGIFN